MSRDALLEEIETSQLKADIPHFNVGDTIKVHIRIIEGEKERTQVFTGTVIARKGSGISETFSMYRVAYGAGMERVFPLHSPRIAKIEVIRLGKVRRAKLYYLRGTAGKAAKVKEKIGRKKGKKGPALVDDPAPPKAEAPKEDKKPEIPSKAQEKKPEDETPKSE